MPVATAVVQPPPQPSPARTAPLSVRPSKVLSSIEAHRNRGRLLPKFYYPYGDPALSPSGGTEGCLRRFANEFRRVETAAKAKTPQLQATRKQGINQEELGQILKVTELHNVE